jgi:SAM-dependent methyltransferase
MSDVNSFVRKSLQITKKTIPVVAISRYINVYVRKLVRLTHRIQFLIEWSVDNPEYFDHNIDMYSSWYKTRESFPVERGVFSSFAMQPNSRVLDLCCGDGFNSYHFYSLRASSVTAIDFDREAIRWAKRNYKAPNLSFSIGDIRTDIPAGPFDNIIWDAAVEHFTEIEIISIMGKIKSALTPKGILSGYTIIEPPHGGKHLHQHEYEFQNKEDLSRFLAPWFKNIHIFETVFPSRTNLYFYATDYLLPFSQISNLFVPLIKVQS